jgi:hypothetical protein
MRPALRQPERGTSTAMNFLGKLGDSRPAGTVPTNKTVRFPPFDDLPAPVLQRLRNFGVKDAGKVGSNQRHVPYESEKKDFHKKTGRTSFESRWPVNPSFSEPIVHTVEYKH